MQRTLPLRPLCQSGIAKKYHSTPPVCIKQCKLQHSLKAFQTCGYKSMARTVRYLLWNVLSSRTHWSTFTELFSMLKWLRSVMYDTFNFGGIAKKLILTLIFELLTFWSVIHVYWVLIFLTVLKTLRLHKHHRRVHDTVQLSCIG